MVAAVAIQKVFFERMCRTRSIGSMSSFFIATVGGDHRMVLMIMRLWLLLPTFRSHYSWGVGRCTMLLLFMVIVVMIIVFEGMWLSVGRHKTRDGRCDVRQQRFTLCRRRLTYYPFTPNNLTIEINLRWHLCFVCIGRGIGKRCVPWRWLLPCLSSMRVLLLVVVGGRRLSY